MRKAEQKATAKAAAAMSSVHCAAPPMPSPAWEKNMDAVVTQLRADGFDVRDEDVARLSRSCGITSTCSAGTPSNLRICPVACGLCATRMPPMRSDRSLGMVAGAVSAPVTISLCNEPGGGLVAGSDCHRPYGA